MANCGTCRILLVAYIFIGFKKQLDMFGGGKTQEELLLLLRFFPSQLRLAVVRSRILGFNFWSAALQLFLSPLGILEIKIFC